MSVLADNIWQKMGDMKITRCVHDLKESIC